MVALRADIQLSGEGKAPDTIVLLKKGVNESDHLNEGDAGLFIFDDISAAMVMQKFADNRRARLYGDWNHGMLQKFATREEAKSCCSFVPAIDGDGNLVATDIDWTDDGREDVESRAYNLFSPAYSWAWGDDGVCRVTGLVNFALVNLAGLKGIPELMAAASAALDNTNTEDTMTEFETKYNEEHTLRMQAEARVRELEGQVAKSGSATHHLAAMSIAFGLNADATDAERVATMSGLVALRSGVLSETGAESPDKALAEVKGLVALRSQVFAITGKTTPAEAVGALQVMKTTADETGALKKRLEDEAIAAMTSEWNGVWTQLDTEKRMSPAEVETTKGALLAITGGKITKELIAGAKIHLSREPIVAAMGSGAVQPKTGSTLITEEDRKMWEQMGGAAGALKLEDIQKYKEQQLARQAGR